MAAGGNAITPPIEGVKQPHVCTVTEILNGTVNLKGKRVAVIGSGMTGLETAEKLAEDGNQHHSSWRCWIRSGQARILQHLDDMLPRLKAYYALISSPARN
ncbi:MAG: NAD(P)/FAD-dependent oxidoreductase [Candidatus Moduliflexus flocculans]|nr:NAD(P)/FAD-dependent oxidoreductase [Candidatus Moduliflexus flocculans]